jgi:hypothetical protein
VTLEPDAIAQLLMGGILALIGYLIRKVLDRLDNLEQGQARNAGRLIRIETKLGIPPHNHLTGDME